MIRLCFLIEAAEKTGKGQTAESKNDYYWLNNNILTVNTDKTRYIIFRSDDFCIEAQASVFRKKNGNVLLCIVGTANTKYLGIVIDIYGYICILLSTNSYRFLETFRRAADALKIKTVYTCSSVFFFLSSSV